MVSVNINHVTLTFPLYALEHRSLKRRLLSLVTFGMVDSGLKTQRENVALRNLVDEPRSLTLKSFSVRDMI